MIKLPVILVMLTAIICTEVTIFTIKHSTIEYDYKIELFQDSIIIDTQHDEHFSFPTDSIDIDEWIRNDPYNN
jgi:hypothetical protein